MPTFIHPIESIYVLILIHMLQFFYVIKFIHII
jgi:hypothetical protein